MALVALTDRTCAAEIAGNPSHAYADSYNVTWSSEPGGAYQIETSADLNTWQPLPGEFLAIGDLTSAPLNLGALGARQFVRILKID